MAGIVKGVLLDESVVLAPEDGNQNLQPGVENLLRKLIRSKIRTGFSYGQDLSADKVSFLKRAATSCSADCFFLNASPTNDGIMVAWGQLGGTVLHLISDKKKDAFVKLSYHGWLTIVQNVGGGCACEKSGLLYINKLEELPSTICNLNRKAMDGNVVTVCYIMKPSREDDFAKRGAFPLCPTENGLIFMPLTFELPLSSQLKEADVILHKATDEIVSIELSNHSSNKITYTEGMQELQRYMEEHPEFCAVDPLNKIFPVVDRLEIQQILLGLEDLNKEGHCKIRGAHFLQVNNFKEPDLVERLSEAKLSLPCIVKPQVACGVAHAHSMAIVFRVGDFKDLSVPVPAVIQEYVDHSSTLFKFYVLGKKVFHAVKKSTPNAEILTKLSESNGLKPLIFDSLKSLPIAKDTQHSGDANGFKESSQRINLVLVTNAANWLARTLDLTIFGFDVVIEESTGDHVIVDVNYLPSFKEVPDDIAIPAFWDAIKRKFNSRKR